MNKVFIAALFAVAFFVSCATQKNAETFYAKNPIKLAEKCAAAFPVKDSVGEDVIDTTHKADNTDYTAAIDSVANAIDSIYSDRKERDKKQFGDSILKQCREVVDYYQDQIAKGDQEINKLGKRVKQLQANYKPCAPDTVYITKTIYRENTAKSAALEGKNAELIKKLAALQESKDHWRGEARKRFWIIIILIALLAGGILAKIKNFI